MKIKHGPELKHEKKDVVMGRVRPDPRKYRPGKLKEIKYPTAREISKSPEFLKVCEELNVKPSVRQARDYRRKIGKYAKK